MINENKSSYYPEIYPYKKGVYSPYNTLPHNKTENRKLGIKIKHKNYEKDIYYFIISINNDWMLK